MKLSIRSLYAEACRVYVAISVVCIALLAASCSSDRDDEPSIATPEAAVEHTLFMYLPWSTDLTSCFYQNIADLEESIVSQGGLDNQRVVVFISTSATAAKLFEITYADGQCQRRDIKSYESPSLTTADGISSILSDVKAAAPAVRYAMTIGCHGMSWLPVTPSGTDNETAAAHKAAMAWRPETALLTRYFGAKDKAYQTDISTLAQAISEAGIRMDFILFDDCYMASVEVAYELKDVADYIIASTCEVMAYGMPYAAMGRHLMGEPDYEAACDEFYAFYSNYTIMPCGTLSVTDCSQLDGLASVMKRINSAYDFDTSISSSLQALDGYSPTLFYAYGDYVSRLVGADNPQLLAEFDEQMARTVPYRVNTPTYYAARLNRALPIRTYSGLTTSDPSSHNLAVDRVHTAWWKATH